MVTLDGEAQPQDTPLPVRPTATLTIGPAIVGVRTYLAVRGGIDVPPVLGSRSRDTLAGIGPPALRNGDMLPIGPAATVIAPNMDVAGTTEPVTTSVMWCCGSGSGRGTDGSCRALGRRWSVRRTP